MNKLCTMQEAVKDAVKDSSTIVIEGFTHLISFAAGHEIIRQGFKDLTLARMTPDLIYDQMVEAGCCKKLIFSWAGNPGVGSLHAIRRKIEKEESSLKIEEYSHFGMLARILAGSKGLPFYPLNTFMGTDIKKNNSNIKEIICPYTQKILSTVPALNPDLSIIHVQRADKDGNGQVWGLMGSQKETAFASDKVILVAEEIVESSVIRSDPNRTLIPSTIVDHVVHEPWGCHPSFAQGYYDRDNSFYIEWDKISRSSDTYKSYLDEFVYGVSNRSEYLKKMNSDLLTKLKAKSKMCQGVDYGY